MNADLYQIQVDSAQFRTPCGGNLQGEQESCVRFAEIPGGIAIQDSKPEGAGREVRFTQQEMDDFVRGYVAEHGLL